MEAKAFHTSFWRMWTTITMASIRISARNCKQTKQLQQRTQQHVQRRWASESERVTETKRTKIEIDENWCKITIKGKQQQWPTPTMALKWFRCCIEQWLFAVSYGMLLPKTEMQTFNALWHILNFAYAQHNLIYWLDKLCIAWNASHISLAPCRRWCFQSNFCLLVLEKFYVSVFPSPKLIVSRQNEECRRWFAVSLFL